ncbi:WAT1-related protein At5g64700-like [Zingiber officinale]|nr:WAT1-related protein At5g64700-like [Zingiber officinale]
MEKLSLKTVRGRARLAGTIFCITGALIFTFWKGHLLGAFVTSPLIQLHFESPEKGDAWLKGSALMLFGYFACSVSLVLQASICEIYPAKLTMNAVMCFFAALQSSALSLIFERNASSWRMFWNVQLMTIIYSGTIVSGLVYYMQIYCVSEKGPVFCAIFTPLGMLVVALVSAFVFAEQLHVGSLIGAVIIILGLYCVLWGKSRDSSENGDQDCEAQKDPGAEKNPSASSSSLVAILYELCSEQCGAQPAPLERRVVSAKGCRRIARRFLAADVRRHVLLRVPAEAVDETMAMLNHPTAWWV